MLADLLTSVLAAAGGFSVIAGVWLVYPPAALIVGGLAVLWGCAAFDRGRE